MKDDLLNKVRTFRTASDLIYLLNPNEKNSATVKVCLPSNENESTLYAIWKNLLGHDNFGVKDDFFQVGGNSLKAVQLISRISRYFAVQIQLTEVFLQPTIEQLTRHILAQKKGELPLSVFRSQPRPQHIPLSFSQERLWFIDRLEGSVQYHIPEVFRLRGHLDIPALDHAFQQIIKRHEVLRTVIRGEEGKEYQFIKEKNVWQLGIIDGSVYKENTEGLQLCITNLINSPFDLSNDDMMRANLIILDEQENILVITTHHIASDGWSIAILFKELTEFYSVYIRKVTSEVAPLSLQYADYAIWQRQHLQGELFEKKAQYWKQKLQGVTSLQLPTDFQRHAEQTINGAGIHFNIDQDLVKQLQELSKQQGATLFMTTLAAFKVLLYRYTAQEDICVGTAIANRTRHEVEDLIGFFVNTLALRNEVNGETSFTGLLQKVKKTTIEAYENQEVPFEKVVEAVVKERDLSRNPLFQVMFVWQNTPEVSDLRLGEIVLTKEPISHDTAKFDLTFSLTQIDNGVAVVVEYNTDLYSKSTIARMIGHFTTLLNSIVKSPRQKIGKLTMLTQVEEHQLLVEFNDTAVDYAKDKTIVDLFEEQASKTPQATAIVFEEKKLTYKELNESANQLGYYLRNKGVKEETLVPICIERSIEMIIGILGILKAGGAYVPIDPEYPLERINFMLEDTGAAIVVSSKEIRTKLKTSAIVEIVDIEAQWGEISGQPIDNLQSTLIPHHLAYVMYTSGSTGKPKGVMVEHGSVVSLVKEINYIHLSAEDVLLSTGSPTFDATTFEYWSMLLNGGQLILCPESQLLNSENLKTEICTSRVNVMWFTSSWMNSLVDLDISVFKGLKTILVGGEKLSEKHINKMRQVYPSLDIINGYGPTENTTFSLTYPVSAVRHSIPIGRPLSNRTAYIVDANTYIVPIGVIGEICIGGAGLARGYLNLPDLTAENFIHNPFDKEAESRIYKTGDLARWLPDGNIEYLGRKDDQVKIRGYRIELGEIESVLQQCAGISQGVVLAREDGSGSKRLVGYVISQGVFDKVAIIIKLKEKLPEYMVPAVWVELSRLPLTSNGKIDRKALPDPDEGNLSGKEYIAPRNEVEEKLVAIWQELLRIGQVGIHDNFFELGGHSILAMRVISAIRKVLKVEMSIKDLFQYTTISDLSYYIELEYDLADEFDTTLLEKIKI